MEEGVSDGTGGVTMNGRQRVPCSFLVLAALSIVLAACTGDRSVTPEPVPSPSPSPTPSGLPGVTPGQGTGPTAIVLVAADPSPGATIAGCGADAAGCAGRIRMTFRLEPSDSGPVLWCVVFLHAASKTACLQGRTEGFALRAGEPQDIEVVLDVPDRSDRCRTPLDLTDLAMTVEGTIEVASRQEWALRYQLAP
jgi:hypothetical protein